LILFELHSQYNTVYKLSVCAFFSLTVVLMFLELLFMDGPFLSLCCSTTLSAQK